MPKKKNPQDATLRNIRALKARVKALECELRKTNRNMLVIGRVHNRLTAFVDRILAQRA